MLNGDDVHIGLNTLNTECLLFISKCQYLFSILVRICYFICWINLRKILTGNVNAS